MAEENHLRVLPAKLDSAIRLRIQRANRRSARNNLLNERGADAVRDALRARSAQSAANMGERKARNDFIKHPQRCLNLLRAVATIHVKKLFVRIGIEHDGLHCSRSDIDSNMQIPALRRSHFSHRALAIQFIHG